MRMQTERMYIDRRGFETENLKVLDVSRFSHEKRENLWHVTCKHCGNKFEVIGSQLKRRRSCGCIRYKPKPKNAEKKVEVSQTVESIVKGRWV